MSIILTEEEYRALQFKPCDRCEALKKRFDDAGAELFAFLIDELSHTPGFLSDVDINNRLRKAFDKFSHTL